MSPSTLPSLSDRDVAVCPLSDPDAGLGALRTAAGNLPLAELDLRASIVGLSSRVVLSQRFVNPHRDVLEATYIFPLPDRGAVTAMRMTAGERTVVATLQERGQARQAYDEAIAAGQRASIAEEERPDVFTMRVGNILPGEQVSIELTVVGVLPVEDDAATFRFPLVVAPRYVPGSPLPGDAVGSGWQPDTDAVPDASRISPPVLLPGFPHPVAVHVEVAVDPAGLPFGEPRTSLPATRTDEGTIRFDPGLRADRDVVLRLPLVLDEQFAALTLVPDAAAGEATDGGRRAPGDLAEGTFELIAMPAQAASDADSPAKDVVLLLDRSGSMSGWKVVAARRAAARIVDTLTARDRFAVLAFDDVVETPPNLPTELVAGTDRNRFRAVEFLAGLTARGGTELSAPMGTGLSLLSAPAGTGTHPSEPASRDRVLVLVTDGQVGNEDQLLRAHAGALGAVRVHTVGIDLAANAGFLGRLASLGGGRCELVESEDRLDEAMSQIHRRIASPLVRQVSLEAHGLRVVPDTVPARLPDVFPSVPYVIRGRYVGGPSASRPAVTLRGSLPDGRDWSCRADGQVRSAPAVTAAWAREHLRALEDRYVIGSAGRFDLEPTGAAGSAAELERRIVDTSLRFGVLCRFTAFIAVDDRVVTDGAPPRHVVQPVEPVAGWQSLALPPSAPLGYATTHATHAAVPYAAAPAAAPVGKARFAAFRAGSTWAASTRAARPQAAAAGGAEPPSLVRELLSAEVTRLRRSEQEPDHRRREALLDLGSRLTVMAEPQLVAAPQWVELLDLLDPDRVSAADLDWLWRQVLRLLEALLAQLPGAGAQEQAATRRRMRPAFWRHHPET